MPGLTWQGPRLQMPTNFLVLRTMCSARVDPEHVLRLRQGRRRRPGPWVPPRGLPLHRWELRTRRRSPSWKILLEQYGLIRNASSWNGSLPLEGVKFQSTITEFVDKIRELGPNPLIEAEKEEEAARAENAH